MTTVKTALRDGARFLKAAGLRDSYLEARLLLLHITGLELHNIYTYPERSLTDAEISALKSALKQRTSGKPSAYITNKREFYGMEFYVDQRVLIPRPETELIVEKLLEHADKYDGKLTIADIGTGCGNIAIALATRLTSANFYAVDISQDALDVARLNAKRLGTYHRINFLCGDLTKPLPERVEVIAANLPYISSGDIQNLPQELSCHEPRHALDGGTDGLTLIRQLLSQIDSKVKPGGCIVMEIGINQAEAVLSMVDDCLPRATVELFKDLNGINRALKLILD